MGIIPKFGYLLLWLCENFLLYTIDWVCVYKHLKVHFASVVFADCWLFTNYESHWDDETIPLTQWIALIRVNDDVNTHQSSLWVTSKHALSHKTSAQTINELAVICRTFSVCKHSFRNSPPLCSSQVCIFSSKSLTHQPTSHVSRNNVIVSVT